MNDEMSKSPLQRQVEVAGPSVVRLLEGYVHDRSRLDLTEPAIPEWADIIEEEYGPDLQKP